MIDFKPNIFEYVDLSTSHITESDAERLALNQPRNPLIVHTYEEGFWVHACTCDSSSEFVDRLERAREYGYSEALLHILRKVWDYSVERESNQDIWWIRFDRDGIMHDDLVKFRW